MADEAPLADSTISAETELDTLRQGIDDPQVLREQIAKETTARRQVTARAIKAETLVKEWEPIVKQARESTKPIVEPSESKADDLWEIADYIREGYSRADVDFIVKNGGRDALKDPNSHVSVALRGIQEQRRAEEAASKVSEGSQMSDAERKFTPEQLRGMTAAELKKILPKAQ